MQRIKQTLVNSIMYLKESLTIKGLLLYIAFFMGLMYVYVAYSPMLMEWYDANIVSILSQVQLNLWLQIFCTIMCIVVICDIIYRFRIRYQFSGKIIFVVFMLTIVLLINRLNEDYIYYDFIWVISYVDIIIAMLSTYFLMAVINRLRLFVPEINTNKELSIDFIIHDNPINSINEDIFDFKDEVKKISTSIVELDKNKTWSLAILAPWGTGKTSFMNLVYEELNTNNFEMLRFNPRNSKSYKNIQEDFFISLINLLSKYDFRCNRTLHKYISALKIKDEKGIISSIINIFESFDREILKESIDKVFSSLRNKVVVLIDDFDRLSKEEIFEVLKLIDNNAAFKNLVFITAYDKEQVNKSLGEIFKTTDSCFVDKFFNLEYSIPCRPYTNISNYLEENLGNNLTHNEKEEIQKTITDYYHFFKEYIITLRDAKRYVNQVRVDYSSVRGDVVIYEFLLVQLIKFRYQKFFKKLYNKKGILVINNMNISKKNLRIKENLKEPEEVLPILKILFPIESPSNTYMHICEQKSFENYFVNYVSHKIRLKDMQALFAKEFIEIRKAIDNWIKNNVFNEFINYLLSKDKDNFDSVDEYIKYSEMVTYLACKRPDSRAYWMFFNILKPDSIDCYKLDIETYKAKILTILRQFDKYYVLLGSIYFSYKTDKSEEKNIFNVNDIWPMIQSEFIKATMNTNIIETELLEWLYRCVDSNNESIKHPILDNSCIKAYRDRVEKNPNFYINNFVRLEDNSLFTDINGVTCEDYWKQIFIDENKFEKFIKKCKDKGIENYDRVCNFWQLYKANDFNPIQFKHQGNVQEKIDNNFANEMKLLTEIREIDKKVSLIQSKFKSLSDVEKSKYKEQLNKLGKQLRDINLNISLKEKLESTIDFELL